MDELAIILLVLLVMVAGGIGLVAAIATAPGRRIKILSARIDRLESTLLTLEARLDRVAPPAGRGAAFDSTAVTPAPAVAASEPLDAEVVQEADLSGARPASRAELQGVEARQPQNGFDWELFIGQKALGWTAVAALLFATAFFIRYAFENAWIGPTGRVSLGLFAGVALAFAGARVRQRRLPILAQMLTAAGVTLLYLSTYSAFGYYHLVSKQTAGVFLTVLIAEAGLLALAYDAWTIALMALVGGLLTPVLMSAEEDEYRSFFLYLGLLNLGSLALLLRRRWPAVRTVALLGTQILFWSWYESNYHPEKFAWAIGFQAFLFLLHLGMGWLAPLRRGDAPIWEEQLAQALNAASWFGAIYTLIPAEDAIWLAPVAIGMAALYAAMARLAINRANLAKLAGLAIALAASYLAIAWPLYARSPWNALGWAAEAAVLWWFGLRIAAGAYRWMAAALFLWVIGDLFDRPYFPDAEHYWFLLNRNAAPALAATACLLLGLAAGARWLSRVSNLERVMAGAAAVIALIQAGAIVSSDLSVYFSQGHESPRLAEMLISCWWGVYATALLFGGFRARLPLLRWLALAIYALTTLKVFFVDLANLDQLVRIVAFFVLALLLGLAAWVYQKVIPANSNPPPAAGE